MKERTPLGRNIESLMGPSPYNQVSLGKEIGVSQSTMSRLLTGQMKPEFELIEKIAKVLRVPIYLVVAGTELASNVPSRCVFTLNPEDHFKWLGYFASALTGASEELRRRIDADAAIARQACEGIQAFLYEPGWYTDPEANKSLSPAQVYEIDYQQVAQSHFVILDARQPSFGAGQELQIAADAGVAVILLVPRDVRVSRMVRGTPARLREINFSNDDELLRGLQSELPPMVADLAAVKDERQKKRVRDIVMGAEQTDGFAVRVKEARVRMGLDEYLVARLVGISPETILQIEAGKYSNPSLVIVRRLAIVLKTSVSMLVDGVAARWEDTDPTMRQSQENLFEFGEEENPKLGPAELQTLWQQYVADVTPKRLAVAETRLEPVTKSEWRQRARNNKKKSGKLFDV